MSTRAIQYLKQKQISFDTVAYVHAQKGAEYAAEATGYPLKMILIAPADIQNTLVCTIASLTQS